MIKFLKILWKIIKTIIWIAVLIVVSIIVVQRVSNNKLTVAGYSIYTVVTKSMIPKYQVGDIIVVKDVDAEELNVGDDITYLGEKDSFKKTICLLSGQYDQGNSESVSEKCCG